MNSKIKAFIEEQNAISVAVIDDEGMPYAFTCLYAFDPLQNAIIFKSDANKTKHGPLLLKSAQVAATILPDTLKLAQIKGIQLTGTATIVESKKLWKRYHKRYPIAVTMPSELWLLRLEYIKFTDNTLGFGKKIEWRRASNADQ